LGHRWPPALHRPFHERIHKHLKITQSEWAAFCKDFDDTMAKFNVPEAEHKELFAIVESTKGDIVSTSSSL
jgi:truncated hemoglobin YjbI